MNTAKIYCLAVLKERRLNHKFLLRNAQQYQAIAKTVYGACPHDMRRTVESITSFFGSKSTEK